jgi:hypothetical protein
MAKKVTLIVLGIIVMLCGFGAVIGGAVLAAVVGSDNTITSPEERYASDTAALVSSASQINLNGMGSSNNSAVAGISVAAKSSGKPIFLGIGPASAVDQYLANATYDEVRDIRVRPFQVDKVRHGTTIGSITAPGDQTFWTVKASGQSPTLNWTVASGDYRVVVMNADGSPGVDTRAIFGVQVVGLHSVGIGAVVCGAIVGLIGLALLIWGIRTKRQPPAQIYAGYPGGGGYPGYGYPAAGYPQPGPEQSGPVQPGAPPVGAEPPPPTEPGYPPANWPQPDYPQPSRPLPEPPQPPAGGDSRP